MTTESPTVSIADAVASLRSQLIEARDRERDAGGITIELSEVEIQLGLVAETTDKVGGEGGFSFAVFTGKASYEAEAKQAHAHTITLKLSVSDSKRKGAVPLKDG